MRGGSSIGSSAFDSRDTFDNRSQASNNTLGGGTSVHSNSTRGGGNKNQDRQGGSQFGGSQHSQGYDSRNQNQMSNQMSNMSMNNNSRNRGSDATVYHNAQDFDDYSQNSGNHNFGGSVNQGGNNSGGQA